eukprot:9937287-Heterocapsa_arctica.AAC.1
MVTVICRDAGADGEPPPPPPPPPPRLPPRDDEAHYELNDKDKKIGARPTRNGGPPDDDPFDSS